MQLHPKTTIILTGIGILVVVLAGFGYITWQRYEYVQAETNTILKTEN